VAGIIAALAPFASADRCGRKGSVPDNAPSRCRRWLIIATEVLLALITAGLIFAMWLPGLLWKGKP
jgi:hypothetical protein